MKPLLIVQGQFICLTETDVFVSLLNRDQNKLLWDSLSLAEDAIKRDEARKYVFKQIFGDDVIGILPASTSTALYAYAEHYDGLHSAKVKGIAACILTGNPFGGGGTKVSNPALPSAPQPGGAAVSLPTAG